MTTRIKIVSDLQTYVSGKTYLLMIATFSHNVFIFCYQVIFVPSLYYVYEQSFQLLISLLLYESEGTALLRLSKIM